MLRYIVNQDRDGIIENIKTADLFTKPVIGPSGKLYGFNLMYGNPSKPDSRKNILLGTFDSVDAAISEIKNIESCEDDYYMIVGHCHALGADDVSQILLSIATTIAYDIEAIKNIKLELQSAYEEAALMNDMEVICGEPD